MRSTQERGTTSIKYKLWLAIQLVSINSQTKFPYIQYMGPLEGKKKSNHINMLGASRKSLRSLRVRWKYDMDSPSFCASPNHLLIKFDILTLMKTAPDSLAIALASMVFPVPGGPYKRTPFWGPRSFPWEKSSGLRSGRITNSYKACLMVSNPPMELNSTSMWSGFITSHAITSC